ncbi:3565_t:CDS:2 [Dentiscutata erythropus]|uniref:2-methoxy-6-polyprenyl-1,4-benzoquinol methylase, mitochondrial n=1 Tax=Dentiscutata erythropus TaxID=1348616 RepID=A0A9N9HG61_9GLOM|nr:3565_t:CDS:2 [Dentiscutata erythropus]
MRKLYIVINAVIKEILVINNVRIFNDVLKIDVTQNLCGNDNLENVYIDIDMQFYLNIDTFINLIFLMLIPIGIGLLRPLITSKSRLKYSEIFREFASSTSQRTSDQQAIKNDDKKEPETNFGFKYVPESMKEKLVGQVFTNVASKYDVMNDAMSLGIHRLWKDYFIRTMAPGPGTKLLDVAGGTGDIAMGFLNYCKEIHGDTSAQVTLLDINPEMVDVGRERFKKTPYNQTSQIQFEIGNAENISTIPSNSFDVYTIAFGIRNCTHIDRVLSEAYRVLRPGGRFMCLEFGKVQNSVISSIYNLYSFQIIPVLGQVIAADRDSYQYLVESIQRFPSQDKFTEMIKDTGFTVTGKGWEDLTFAPDTEYSPPGRRKIAWFDIMTLNHHLDFQYPKQALQ